jgi:receptor protein-tyrosine kinase
MSAEATTEIPQVPDQDIHDALVLLHSLPSEAVHSIHEMMRSLHLGFAEAALHTGLINQDQLDEAMEWIRRRAARQSQASIQGGGIIEEVLRRKGGSSQRRELVLWEGPKLKPSEQLIVAHDAYHRRSESIRGLATDLLMRTRNIGGAVLAILSPCSGEGRSQLAAELAIALSQLGRRTLLVDADLHHPRQHVLFNAENDTGLAQALLEEGAVRMHGIGGLPQMGLVTSGVLPANPLELLSGVRFEQLVAEWRRSFQFVLLDTPPAAASSDAIAVASAAGNVLLLSRANITPFNDLKEMSRKLETTQARTLGAVIGKF